jgi:hypothetical protein
VRSRTLAWRRLLQGLDGKVTLLPNGSGLDLAAILTYSSRSPRRLIRITKRSRSGIPIVGHISEIGRSRKPYRARSWVRRRVDVKLLLIGAQSKEGKSFSELMVEATQRILDVAPLRDGRHAGVKAAMPDGADVSEAALQKADTNWLDATRSVTCPTASIFGLIMVRGSRADHRLHMEAGRLWQRLHLEGTARGLAMQPMNHHIEVIDFEASADGTSSMAARMDLGADWKAWEPIFGFRAGYAGAAPARRADHQRRCHSLNSFRGRHAHLIARGAKQQALQARGSSA